MKKLLTLLLTLIPLSVNAWWETPHMLVAQIAYEHLDPDAKKEVDRLSKSQGRSPYTEVRFDEAADWMDAIKNTGLHALDVWHYMTEPYNPTSFPLPEISQPQNARWALNKAISILKQPEADDLEKAFMLRVLTHVTGDVHQPLHVITLFSKEFPKGDQGGNLVKLSNVDINGQELKELHAAWDFACGEFPTLKISEDKAIYETLPKLSKLLQEKLPKEEMEQDITTNVDTWLNESLALGIKDVYNFNGKALVSGSTPSDAYFQNCRDVCRRQVALAGYRLAAVLNEIYGKKKE